MGARIDLSGPYRKAAWAEKRFAALREVIDEALHPGDGSQPLELGADFDETELTVLLRIEHAPELPWYTGMMIGDVLHNLRSALDHTAWALVEAGTTPVPSSPRLVQFPIYDDAGNFSAQVTKRLPGVSSEAVAIIESVQPYQRGATAEALGVLARLSNEDKHRHIPASVVGTASFNLSWTGIDCDIESAEMLFEIPDVPDLVVGTPLFRIHVSNIRAANPSVRVDGDITPYVAIESRWSLTHRLAGIRDAVLDTMTRLDPDVAALIHPKTASEMPSPAPDEPGPTIAPA